jgi:hypothetical protein
MNRSPSISNKSNSQSEEPFSSSQESTEPRRKKRRLENDDSNSSTNEQTLTQIGSSSSSSTTTTTTTSSSFLDTTEEGSVKEETFGNCKGFKEGTHYYEFDKGDQDCLSQYRQLKVRQVFKTFQKVKKFCNYICLRCYQQAETPSAFFVIGEFLDVKKHCRTSNIKAHLTSVHGMTFNEGPKESDLKVDLFHDSIVNYIIEESQPLNIVRKPSFQAMFRNGGAIFDLPGRHLVDKIVSSKFEDLKKLIKSEIQPLLNFPKCMDGTSLPILSTFSDDVKNGQDEYTGHGISYITSDWKYRDISMFLFEKVSGAKATSDMIIEQLSTEIGVSPEFLSMAMADTTSSAQKVGELIVGDSNKCLLHLVGLILGHCTGTKHYQIDNEKVYFEVGRQITTEVIYLMDAIAKGIEDLVPMMVEVGIDHRHRAKYACETRPSSNHTMFLQALKLYPALAELAKSKRKKNDPMVVIFKQIDWDVIVEVEALLLSLTLWTTRCQTARRPMLSWNLICNEIVRVDYSENSDISLIDLGKYATNLLSSNSKELPRRKIKINELSEIGTTYVSKIRELSQDYLDSDNHGQNALVSTYLDPMARKLMMTLNPDLMIQARKLVHKITIELAPAKSSSSSSSSVPKTIKEDGKSIIILDASNDEVDDDENLDTAVALELDAYEKMQFPQNWVKRIELSTCGAIEASENSDPLDFWALHSPKLPLLTRGARFHLCAPGSNATQERFFSALNRVRTDKRHSLGTGKMEALSSVQMNSHLLSQVHDEGSDGDDDKDDEY